jgi:hypothetical protein
MYECTYVRTYVLTYVLVCAYLRIYIYVRNLFSEILPKVGMGASFCT